MPPQGKIRLLRNAMRKLRKLQGVEFELQRRRDGTSSSGRESGSAGVIAQDVESVAPELVEGEGDARDNPYRGVNLGGVVGLLDRSTQGHGRPRIRRLRRRGGGVGERWRVDAVAGTSVKATAASALGVSPPFSVNTRSVRIHLPRRCLDRWASLLPRSLKRQLQLMRGRAYQPLPLSRRPRERLLRRSDLGTSRALGASGDPEGPGYLLSGEPPACGGFSGDVSAWPTWATTSIITDRPEAVDLTDDFSGPNDGIDVFYVQSILNAGGWSTTPGPCDKDAKDEMTGGRDRAFQRHPRHSHRP